MTRYQPCPKCRENGRDNRGDNLVSYSDGGAHCFSCGYHIHPKHYIPKTQTIEHKTLLPRDFTREVPAAALRWLLQYGLPYTYWKDQIGFSPKEERLVFLVGKPLQFSIGRYVGNAEVKPRKWYVWGDSHRHCEVVRPRDCEVVVGNTNSDTRPRSVVLVEDLISAHKIATSGSSVAAIPLFGVEIHKPHLYYLMQEADNVVMWLDQDQAGSIMRKAAHLQGLLNVPVSVVSSTKDPKELSFNEINERLGYA